MTSANSRVFLLPTSPLSFPYKPSTLDNILPTTHTPPPHPPRGSLLTLLVWSGNITTLNVNCYPYCPYSRRASWHVVRKHYLKCELLQSKWILCKNIKTEREISSCGLFFCTYRIFFHISCKADLVVLNSSNFCLFVKLFISPSNLNDSLAR